MNKEKVLVTGVSGYLGSHCVKVLLERGYYVVGTVRSLKDKEKYQELFQLTDKNKGNLEIVEGDILDSECWDAIMSKVTKVLHVASPCIIKEPKDPQKFINTSIQGVKNILNSSIKNNIKKVVFTSSTTAVSYGEDVIKKDLIYDERDFSSKNMKRTYNLSKLLSEKEAWDIYQQNK